MVTEMSDNDKPKDKYDQVYACNVRDLGSIPGSGTSLGERATHSSLSSLENSMDRGAWWATVHGVTKSWTWLILHDDTCRTKKITTNEYNKKKQTNREQISGYQWGGDRWGGAI